MWESGSSRSLLVYSFEYVVIPSFSYRAGGISEFFSVDEKLPAEMGNHFCLEHNERIRKKNATACYIL